jgi:hypothetical protein
MTSAECRRRAEPSIEEGKALIEISAIVGGGFVAAHAVR